jgi:hypothetical protein
MNKFSLVKLSDLLSFIGLLGLISTGLFLRFVLPPRSGLASVWGLTRHEWGEVHFYVAVVFLALISSHFFLHLSFIKKVLAGDGSREHKYRLVIGLTGVIMLTLLLFAPLFSPVHS